MSSFLEQKHPRPNTNPMTDFTYSLSESVWALICTPIAVSHTISNTIWEIYGWMSITWPSPCGDKSDTIIWLCRSNVSTNCSNIEKWKAGVMILRRFCHFLPLLSSNPSANHGRNTEYIPLFPKKFELLLMMVSNTFASTTVNAMRFNPQKP